MKNFSGLTLALIVAIVLIVGVAAGMFVRPAVDRLLGPSSAADEHDHDEHADEHAEDHLPLSFEAVQNLNLLVRPVELSSFTAVRRMPGEIVEAPGLSSQKVAAPVSGKVARLFASPGASIAPGERLLEIEIIDDKLMDAQLRLLELMTKREIVSAELKRFTPLAESGGVAGRKKIEIEYQQKEVDASLSRVRQELGMRGLSTEQIESIEQSQQTINRLIVVAPPIGSSAGTDKPATPDTPAAVSQRQLESSLALEDLLVEVGQNVSRGEAVCSLAVHGLLMVCGHAFENDIDLVSHAASDGTSIAIEFGTSDRAKAEPGFQIQYVAGHVDEKTQTFHFFVPLKNDVVRESTDALGRVFRTWRYKVGQRVHLLIPIETMNDQIVLPRDAVVQVGPEYFAFREAEHDHSAADHAHDHDVYMEMEPVPVRVRARDKQSFVIEPGGELQVGDMAAINAAYQMHLALKAQQEGGGGGHDHGHSH